MYKKVLIVEDSADIGDSLKILIEMEGYEAVVATSGLDSLQKASEEHPHLILIDLSLPDMDGVELTRRLRSDPNFSEIPILCVSSYVRDRRAEILAAGCNDVFSKTSFMVSFGSTLEKYLKD